MYVQSSIGSRNSAIHNVYHTSLRPSSLLEPRHLSLKVVNNVVEMTKTRSGHNETKQVLKNQQWQEAKG
jgi:hypothetical protein